jgi:hypothetical protein
MLSVDLDGNGTLELEEFAAMARKRLNLPVTKT